MVAQRKLYVCIRCGKTFSKEDMELTPGVRCPQCGYRIVMKTRSVAAKRIKAR